MFKTVYAIVLLDMYMQCAELLDFGHVRRTSA